MPDPGIPEFYVDKSTVTISPFGAALSFGLNPPHPSPGQQQSAPDTVRLRMSLEHAKLVSMLLRRQLKLFEEQMGAKINMPSQVYNSVGLSQEDW